MQLWRWHCVAGVAGLLLIASLARGQSPPDGVSVVIPPDARALQGLADVRFDITSNGTNRRELDPAHAGAEALAVDIVDGRYYWTSRENRPLKLTSVGEFTYLTSTEPGKYIRLRRFNDKVTYVEHVDTEFGSVTYWGELRIVLRKAP